ncbi:SusC/RagA family TonB-linked outer membrane protein [Reichenbachiella sp. MALMAid0571]|uniref:SusC/RagA family TonB-linked outer membrane protein n=1 Tax=Reichenbachiella sp. MALMAid0571 TaxID=3143939 RepID=UPI0032DE3970
MSKYAIYGIFMQCILFSFVFAGYSTAQNMSMEEIHVTVEFDDLSIKESLEKLEKLTDFKFAYKEKIVSTRKKLTFDKQHISLANLLRNISKETSLGFKRINETIYVNKLEQPQVEEVIEDFISADVDISGTITDENGIGLPGASVVVKGSINGTTSDLDGNYRLSVPEGSVLTISFVGYVNQEISVGTQSVINVKMEVDTEQLKEVVVIGYGTVKKSDLTGSVASVGSENIAAYPTNNAVQALQGRVAGVSITQVNGEPGSGYKVSIRGNTSINASSDPLFVVDGFPGGVLPPPEDIQSIEILKDASATAIYGSRGANGVVMVTTKSGNSGATRITFNSSWSSQKQINKVEVLNGSEYAEYINEIDPGFYSNPSSFGVGTDWQEELFRTGGLQNYQMSISGGTEKVQYYLSGVYYDQKGIVENSDFKRYSITSNINLKASEKVRFGANLFARGSKLNGVNSQRAPGSSQADVIAGAYVFPTTQSPYDADGNYVPSNRGFQIDNPLAVAKELDIENLTDLFQGNFFGEIDILKGLKFRSSIGGKVNSSRYGRFYPTTLLRGQPIGGEGEMRFSKRRELLTENYFTYSKQFGNDHNLSLTAGSSLQTFSTETLRVLASTFPTNANLWWDLSAASSSADVSSSLDTQELSSWFGRVNYSFMGKYLLTFNGRYDGSSVLADGNKWKFFPSAAIAWNVSEESFLSNSSDVSQLKFRASYGKTGNQAIGPFESLAQFTSVFTTQGNNVVTALRPSSLGNSDLNWETTAQTNIGIDLGLWDDRITLTADYYKMITSDLLFNVELPGFIGVATQIRNIGEVENSGLEFTLGSKLITAGDFSWNANANISFNKNKILKLVDNDTEGNDLLYGTVPLEGSSGLQSQILREGESVGSFYGFVYDGVLQSSETALTGTHSSDQVPGGRKFKDLNNDGELTADDRTIIGNPHPDFVWGVNNSFKYKSFDLNIFIQGNKGGDIMNYTRMELGLMNGRTNASKESLNRWTPSNTDTNIPSANSGRVFIVSDRWVEDASFMRLKNIALGYTVNSSVLEKIAVRSARIYISAQNLMTITGYKGVDPEVAYANSNTNLGLDYATYPNVKSYTIGINIGF